MGANTTYGLPLASWAKTDGPAAVELSCAVTFARRVRPALLRASIKPVRKVASWPKTAGVKARRSEAAEKRRIVVGVVARAEVVRRACEGHSPEVQRWHLYTQGGPCVHSDDLFPAALAQNPTLDAAPCSIRGGAMLEILGPAEMSCVRLWRQSFLGMAMKVDVRKGKVPCSRVGNYAVHSLSQASAHSNSAPGIHDPEIYILTQQIP